jgi:Uma2 family endonuclease
MTRVASRSADPSDPTDWSIENVQYLYLEGVSWELYEHLLKVVGNRPLRLTYDNGELEIMSPLPEHEAGKKLLGRMAETLGFELNWPMRSYGSTTFRRKDRAKGLEPDECYYFRNESRMRGKKRWIAKRDPPPDLVIEIDITSRSVAREPIYAALGVPEIWRYERRSVKCLHLVGGNYVERRNSLVFPFLQPAELKRFVDMLAKHDETTIMHSFVKWVRKQGWAKSARP